MRKRSRQSGSAGSSGEQGFWPSYADMMSSVALVLFFLMLLSYVTNMINGQKLLSAEADLKDALDQLAVTSAEVKAAQEELQVIFADLEIAKQDLDAQQVHIDEQQAYISEQESTLAQQKTTLEEQAAYILQQQADIEAQRQTIAQQKSQADQQEAYLKATQSELSVLRNQMQSVAVLRVEIVEQIRQNIEAVMGNTNTVTVNENGNLVLGESVLFGSGSSELTSASYKSVLDQLANGFNAFLSNPDNTKYVDSIVIGGHADNTGGETLNRKLSTERANSVLNYLMEANGGVLSPYASYFCAAGYSSSRPVADNSSYEGRAQNRRIEISIVLKDDSVLDILNQYLQIEVPQGVG